MQSAWPVQPSLAGALFSVLELSLLLLSVRYLAGIGLRAGMCFLDGGRAVVHIPSSVALGSERLDRLVLIDLAKPSRINVATPLRLLEPLGVQPGATERPGEPSRRRLMSMASGGTCSERRVSGSGRAKTGGPRSASGWTAGPGRPVFRRPIGADRGAIEADRGQIAGSGR